MFHTFIYVILPQLSPGNEWTYKLKFYLKKYKKTELYKNATLASIMMAILSTAEVAHSYVIGGVSDQPPAMSMRAADEAHIQAFWIQINC